MRVTPDAVLRPVWRQKKVAARLPLPPPRRRPRGQHPPPVFGEEDDDDNALLRKTSRRRRRRQRPATGIVASSPSAAAETAVTAAPAPALEASPRLWALLREAQEEMERGTDVLGDELNILWQNVREGATDCGRETKEMAAAAGAADGGGSGGDGGERGSGRGNGQRLPRREADVLLDGLEALQAEMEAEASSFQRQKSELMRKLRALPIGGGRGGAEEAGRGDVGERRRRGSHSSTAAGLAMELEEEAESMRTAVIASHARLLGRVREVGLRNFLSVTGRRAVAIGPQEVKDSDEACSSPQHAQQHLKSFFCFVCCRQTEKVTSLSLHALPKHAAVMRTFFMLCWLEQVSSFLRGLSVAEHSVFTLTDLTAM